MSTVSCARFSFFPSVPYAPGPMMRDGFLSFGFHLLHKVVQEEVDQDGVDLDLGVVPFDLSPDQFDTPDAAGCIRVVLLARQGAVTWARNKDQKRLTSQLQLPLAPTRDRRLLLDGRAQRGAVRDAAQGGQDLGDPVVGKHGDLVNVPEGAVARPLEAGPQVGDEDLGALEEADGPPAALVAVLVAEAGKVPGEEVDQAGGGAPGGGDAVGGAAGVLLREG